MRRVIYTYNGTEINDGVNYEAWFAEFPTQPTVEMTEAEIADTWSVYVGKRFRGFSVGIDIKMLGTLHTQLEALKGLFDVEDIVPRQLIVKDAADNDKQWYVYCTPLGMGERDGQVVTVVLGLVSPVWQTVDQSVSTWSITSSGATKAITVGGNKHARPIIEITPTVAKSGGYGYKRWVLVYNPLSVAIEDYPVNLTDDGSGSGTLDFAALVAAGKMQSDADDVRVQINGAEVYKWIAGENSTQGKIWVNLTLQPGVSWQIADAIGSTGTPSAITCKDTRTNRGYYKLAPSSGLLLIGNEVFSYANKDSGSLIVTGIERALKGTTAATHSAGSTATVIEHDIWVLYGNPADTGQDVDDDYKPCLDLDNSTNLHWAYANYNTNARFAAAAWRPTVSYADSDDTDIYTATQGDNADPYTVMGGVVAAYQKKGRWTAESADIRWLLRQPYGIGTGSFAGEKYMDRDWLDSVKMYRGSDGKNWTTVFAESLSTAKTWYAFTQSNKSIGGSKYLLWRIAGTVSGRQDNKTLAGINTVELDLSGAPYVKICSESGAYHISGRIINQTTGDWMDVLYAMSINDTLYIDTDALQVYDSKGAHALGAKSLSDEGRTEWLKLEPGVNTLEWQEAGVAGVTVAIKWRDRNN